MTELFNCGFARVALKTSRENSAKECRKAKNESNTKFKIRSLQSHREHFNKFFSGYPTFETPAGTFNAKVPKILDAFRNWNPRKYDERERYLETFSPKNWETLPTSKKKEHNFFPMKGRRLTDITFSFDKACRRLAIFFVLYVHFGDF